MSSIRLIYRPRTDTTPVTELGALSQIYAFVLRTHQEREKAAPSSRPDIHFDSQAREGASHDLTRDQITEAPKTDRGKTEKEKT